MKPTPYTTKTGIRIGCNYQPPQNWVPSGDMERLQSSLLGSEYRTTAERFWDAVLWTVSVAMIAMLVIGVHYA